jgi:hypothetical protein
VFLDGRWHTMCDVLLSSVSYSYSGNSGFSSRPGDLL